MDDTDMSKSQMKNAIRQISRYQGYLISRYITILLLFLCVFYYGIIQYPVYSSYILIFALPAPAIIRTIFTNFFSSRIEELENSFFPALKEKYHFSQLHYLAETITFFIISFLIILWQTTLLRFPPKMPYSNIIPSSILCIYVIARVVVSFYYQQKLHYNLINNIW